MNYSKIPHVCFSFELSLQTHDDKKLWQLLEHQLLARCEAVEVRKSGFLFAWRAELLVGRKRYFIFLRKSSYAAKEWILHAQPPTAPKLLDLLFRRDTKLESVELSEFKQTCRAIHAALEAISGITLIRWYFQGIRGRKGISNQSAAVTTPDELPWDSQQRKL